MQKLIIASLHNLGNVHFRVAVGRNHIFTKLIACGKVDQWKYTRMMANMLIHRFITKYCATHICIYLFEFLL